MQTLKQDIWFALRILAKNPGFTVAAVLALGLGVGANTAVFSFVNAFFLRPMPFEEPSRLYHLWETDTRQGFDQVRVSMPDFLDWREQTRAFTDLAAFNYSEENLTGLERPLRVKSGIVSANAFRLLGAKTLLGRTFDTGEDAPGRNSVALISEAFWRGRMDSDPQVLHKTLQLDGREYAVVGVMPRQFLFPLPNTEVWIPRVLDGNQSRDRRYLQVFGRLAGGVTAWQAQEEMNRIAAGLSESHPQTNADVGVNLEPLKEALNFADEILRPMSLVLAAAVIFVLLIACANVANLLLSRAARRRREMALRSALGAASGRLVRQLMTENALVALLGASLGIGLAYWGTQVIAALIPDDLYKVGRISVDSTALLFTLGLALMTSLIFGLLPAFEASRLNLIEALKNNDRSGATRGGSHLHRMLVSGQIAMSLVLLTGSALMIQSLWNMRSIDPGFEASSVLSTKVILPGESYPNRQSRADFHRQAVERIGGLPTVLAASTVNNLPLNHEYDLRELTIDGRPRPERPWIALVLTVGADYFETMGIPLERGRSFDDRERLDSPSRIVISNSMARRYWPNSDPIGASISLDGADEPLQVIGIAADSSQDSLDASERHPQIFLSQAQFPRAYFRILVRTQGDPLATAASVREQIWSLDPDLPLTEVATLQSVVDNYLLPQRSVSQSLFVLAFGALALAGVGLYALMALFVNQRVREIGIRIALGARRLDVFELVVGQAFRLAVIGVALGAIGAYSLGRLMSSFLFGMAPSDPTTFIGAGLFLGLLALVAAAVPARRAGRIDPIQALRSE